MKILIGGSGSLGRSFFNLTNKNQNIKAKIIPLKESTSLTFKNEFNELNKGDVFIDFMDPNDVNMTFDISLNKKANIFRKYALKHSEKKIYIYISTCNLYKTSLGQIDESSEIKSKLSPYLEMKLNSEEKIKRFCQSDFAILRIVNVWSHDSKNSFFGDLLSAKSNNTYIKPRENDKEVISYAHILDVCKIIEAIITSQKLGIINISTNCFNSRENLKAIVNEQITNSIANNLGYRICSNVINWKTILGKKKELF